jgi:membrane protease YdiL (CAAX protease family)
MPWDFALILVVLGVLVPWRGFQRVRELLSKPALESRERIAIFVSTILVQWPAALVVLWRCRARGVSFDRLGLALPDPALCLAVTFLLSLVLVLVQFAGLRRMARLPQEKQGLLGDIARKLMPASALERRYFLALVATVAICEEFLYRGFALAVLDDSLPGLVFGGAVLSSALFAVAHIYQGRRGLVTTFVVGMIFAGAREYTGSLAPSIAAHFAADLVAGIVAPRLLGTRENTLGKSPEIKQE